MERLRLAMNMKMTGAHTATQLVLTTDLPHHLQVLKAPNF